MAKHDLRLDDVAVHRENAAPAVGAHAFATGTEIQMAPGDGQEVVAHEAQHAVQQRAGRVPPGAIDDALGHYGE